ncbi:alpha/beta fold hydrolase [Phaeobacter porticola]|uniref:Putative hydrolase or acyltransferase (Alpha/beta hydrolase superfamily) n=1 Tax=Phaeobacter porticola TaxID=1844006 RepID=A0A1L3I6J1_9RHOB|nr:alpha/beta hydrolase [Phaeobacter porticola]APG47768.1 putative hydrolase or acyltransferase (alpha/beta hydrolase superfamily) [Phaeobacter porticola]
MTELASGLAQPVFTRSYGQGSRCVLGVHCSLAHSGAWRGLASVLDPQVTLSSFDMLSHGRSPDWDGDGLLQLRNAEAGLALIEAENLAKDGPIDLIGHSFGATVAFAMAQMQPELVRSLVMVEPVFFSLATADGNADPQALEQLRREHKIVRETYLAGDVEQATRLFNRAWGAGHPKWHDLPESARDAMVRSFPAVMACDTQVYEDMLGVLTPEGLARVTMPCLLIDGGKSQPIMHEVIRALAARLPDVTCRRIDSAGHMLPITHPAETAALLQGFWPEVVPAPAEV